jgi:hypothetical protein
MSPRHWKSRFSVGPERKNEANDELGLARNPGLRMNSVRTHPNWVELYRAALIETNKAKLRDRIQSAQKVLHERAGELTGNGNGSAEERLAIADALRALSALIVLYELQ